MFGQPAQRRRRLFLLFTLIVFVAALACASSACQRQAPPAEPTPTPTPEPTPPPGIPLEGSLENGETLSDCLTRFEVSADDAKRIVAALRTVDFPFRKLRPNHTFTLWIADDSSVTGFDFFIDRLTVYRLRAADDDSLQAQVETVPTRVETHTIGARVQTSVYQAILDQGETDGLASLVSNLFAWDINFYTDPRVGDGFRLVFEKRLVADGEVVGYGHLLAAMYDGEVTGEKRGYWFEAGDPDWDGFYDVEGKQLRKTFLVAPLDTMRITSRFGMRRHPILHRRQMHHGVDYGAPRGTPVWAVANGQVIGAGSAGAAGRMVKIQHVGGYVTMYLHLSRVTVRTGQHVNQRQMIGRVGSTGRSTGPHLDFRVKHNGRYVNPQRLRMIASPLKVLPELHREAFAATIAALDPQLEAIALPPVSTADQAPTEAMPATE